MVTLCILPAPKEKEDFVPGHKAKKVDLEKVEKEEKWSPSVCCLLTRKSRTKKFCCCFLFVFAGLKGQKADMSWKKGTRSPQEGASPHHRRGAGETHA